MLRRADSGWSNPRVLLIFSLIFICGVGFGAVVAREILHARMTGARNQEVMDSARRIGMKRLIRELNLTPDQVRIVTRELDDYAKYYQNIEEERADVAEHGRRRILDVLTDQQKKRFYEIFGKDSPH